MTAKTALPVLEKTEEKKAAGLPLGGRTPEKKIPEFSFKADKGTVKKPPASKEKLRILSCGGSSRFLPGRIRDPPDP